MFQFPASAVAAYVFSSDFQGIALERFRIRGSPVELARSKPRLIAAVPRPSSPLNARASTMHPIELDHTFLFLFRRSSTFKHSCEGDLGSYLCHSFVKERFKFDSWWRRQDSNPRPSACKAGALPTELRPQQFAMNAERCGPNQAKTALTVVHPSGLEPLTSRLSGACSNQLSYGCKQRVDSIQRRSPPEEQEKPDR
jgi:hypothetical protein